jgi:Domain of unknown function (DUF397)
VLQLNKEAAAPADTMTGGKSVSDVMDANGSDQSPVWIKSSLSFANGNCVEAARLSGGYVGVRDSKDPHGGMLRFTPAEWSAFLSGVRDGEFDALTSQHP